MKQPVGDRVIVLRCVSPKGRCRVTYRYHYWALGAGQKIAARRAAARRAGYLKQGWSVQLAEKIVGVR